MLKLKLKYLEMKILIILLAADKLVGVPSKAEIVDIGVGKSFINRYKQKYNLA